LLALDLPVPDGHTLSALLTSARHNDGHYGAFLISFGTIAAAWGNHHDVFRYTRRIDARLRTLNMIWLLMIVLIPFATRLLTASGNSTLGAHALRFGFYSLLQVLQTGALLAILRHMVSRGQMPGAPRSVVTRTTRQCYALIAGFGLSIPLFFVTTYAWPLWFAIPSLAARGERFTGQGWPGRRDWPWRRGDAGPNPPHG
jgi:uncharacterized membrane protein